MATLTNEDIQSIRQIAADSRTFVASYWRWQLMKDRWHAQGGLLETITQPDLDAANMSDVDVDDLKDVEFWMTTNIVDNLDDTIGLKMNKIGSAVE